MGNKLVTAFHNDKTDRRPRIPARRSCLPGRHAHLLPTPTGPGPQPRRFRTSRRLRTAAALSPCAKVPEPAHAMSNIAVWPRGTLRPP